MPWEPIRKPTSWAVAPNMLDYGASRESFSWAGERGAFLGAPRAAGFNIADLAVDRHAEGPLAGKTALRWIAQSGARRDITFAELRELSNRFANILRELGVREGESVFALTGRIPEHHVAALGTFKNRSVFCPLFSAFGPGPLEQRLRRGDARLLLTTRRLYERNVAGLRAALPELRHILIVDAGEDAPDGVLSLPRLMQAAAADFTVPQTEPEETALLHFTSGTTGMPKGAVHVHEAALMHYVTGKYALDLHPDDLFWCTADPGWVTGMSYGVIAPLLHGVTNLLDESEFDAQRWYETLARERVTVWYTAPTAIRMLMRVPIEPRKTYDLSALRLVASVGEPLNPSAVVWGKNVLGLPIHDNWWQTETGGIMIANYPAMEIRPGSMGRPLPGVEAALVRRGADGASIEVVGEADQEGELALRPGWPSMFRGYLHDDERYAKSFAGDWYLTGDLAQCDADGYFTFVGRTDDIIKTAGHMVGPFEVESALMEHPAVAEAGVIGKPEPTIGELVKAFVVLKPGFTASDELRLELLGFGRQRLGSAVAPKELEFKEQLPRTRSGKIMRRLLRARELGLPEGDISTLEPAS
ncbi:MAG: acetate--CoA ligase [Candidatus Lustribacter sp.]|jgi:acetyl-CoA synthetase